MGLRVPTAGAGLSGAGTRRSAAWPAVRGRPRAREEKTLRAGGPDWGPVGVDFGPREGLRSPETPGKAGPGQPRWSPAALPGVGIFCTLGREGLLGRGQVVQLSNGNFFPHHVRPVVNPGSFT